MVSHFDLFGVSMSETMYSVTLVQSFQDTVANRRELYVECD